MTAREQKRASELAVEVSKPARSADSQGSRNTNGQTEAVGERHLSSAWSLPAPSNLEEVGTVDRARSSQVPCPYARICRALPIADRRCG
jgi:hypothetical protein